MYVDCVSWTDFDQPNRIFHSVFSSLHTFCNLIFFILLHLICSSMCHIEFKTNKLHFNTSSQTGLHVLDSNTSNLLQMNRTTWLQLELVFVIVWNATTCDTFAILKNTIYRIEFCIECKTTCWFLVKFIFQFNVIWHDLFAVPCKTVLSLTWLVCFSAARGKHIISTLPRRKQKR